ncbi:MAG: hypothetical protein P1V51_00185 [Deltaproteobacteria bacterium]|nr:hypothetical protein [Deltaproteobacteria bacterium]
MKTVLRLLPAFLCCLLMGAHFLRLGMLWAVIACCVFPFVLFLRHPAVRWAVVAALTLGFVSWILTTLQLVMVRMQTEAPFVRLAIILGAVALFHLVAAALLFGERMRGYFHPSPGEPASPSSA